jgi:hypothetical protein
MGNFSGKAFYHPFSWCRSAHHTPQSEQYHLNYQINDLAVTHPPVSQAPAFGAPAHLGIDPPHPTVHHQPTHPDKMLWRQGAYTSEHVDNRENHEGGRRGWQVPRAFNGISDKNYHKGGHFLPKHHSL